MTRCLRSATVLAAAVLFPTHLIAQNGQKNNAARAGGAGIAVNTSRPAPIASTARPPSAAAAPLPTGMRAAVHSAGTHAPAGRPGAGYSAYGHNPARAVVYVGGGYGYPFETLGGGLFGNSFGGGFANLPPL